MFPPLKVLKSATGHCELSGFQETADVISASVIDGTGKIQSAVLAVLGSMYTGSLLQIDKIALINICQSHMISAELKSRSPKKCSVEYKNRRKLLCYQGIKIYYSVIVKLKDNPELFSIVFIPWHLRLTSQ